MKPSSLLALVVSCAVLGACYHATITTGATPSSDQISQPWASGWIYGLVPPSTVEAAAKCPNGVAQVETQHSFLNELVGFLTIGIYTPMSILVTCAAAPGATSSLVPDLTVSSLASAGEMQAVLETAADQAAAQGEPVFIQVK
jgi:Bor protein